MPSEIKINLNKKNKKILEKSGFEVIETGEYYIHENIKIEGPSRLRILCAGDIELGAFSFVQSKRIDEHTNVKIGRYCSIALEAKFNLGSHPTNWISTSDFQYTQFFLGKRSDNHLKNQMSEEEEAAQKTIIGNDVWIGDSVLIKSGVKVGDGAVIGAGAIVLKNVPPYAIVAGVPAKIIRYRFTPEIIEKLLALKWWDYCYYDFKDVDFEKVESAIDQIENLIKNGMQKYQPKVLTQKDFYKFQSLRRRLKSSRK